jgi:hypothetical protein
MGIHFSHVTRFSDASSFDLICVNCSSTDQAIGGWGKLAEPCPKPVGQGGQTYEEWMKAEDARIKRLRESAIPA